MRYVPLATYSTYPVNSSSTPLPKVSLEQYSFAYYKFVPPTNLPGDVMNIHLNATQAVAAKAFRKDTLTQVISELTFSNVYPSFVAIPNVSGASEIVLLLVNTSGSTTQNANFSTDGSLLVNDPVTSTPPPTTTTTPPTTGRDTIRRWRRWRLLHRHGGLRQLPAPAGTAAA